LIARHERVVIDLGCGDGRGVLAAASAEPRSLVIGIDASGASMGEASRRAAAAGRRGGLPNALFVVSAAEAIEPVIDGVADAVSVLFPWGSLLRGMLGLDSVVPERVARLLQPGGRLAIVLSVSERDRVDGMPCFGAAEVAGVAARWSCHGLFVRSAHRLHDEEITALPSTWARRLRAGRDFDREVWRLELATDLGA
jgi:16S rRNA (adenine(1408)-N(1))-methyltransferase